jgi:hypothetical protein
VKITKIRERKIFGKRVRADTKTKRKKGNRKEERKIVQVEESQIKVQFVNVWPRVPTTRSITNRECEQKQKQKIIIFIQELHISRVLQ